jgi:BASS family bile acid:Na+ symporter
VLLFLPLALAVIMKKFTPNISNRIGSYSSLSFYLWSLALCVVTGRIVVFILKQNGSSHWIEILVAVGALVMCVSQFIIGRGIGNRYDDTVAGGQGLGQKNTILAIWMAQMYLNPISSIGPGSYVLWQNIINSYQVWRNRKSI